MPNVRDNRMTESFRRRSAAGIGVLAAVRGNPRQTVLDHGPTRLIVARD
jgi:hypothetical protein